MEGYSPKTSELSSAVERSMSGLAQDYRVASRKRKTQILTEVVRRTGWNRDYARVKLLQYLAARTAVSRSARSSLKYSAEALRVLHQVWESSGGSCGKHLAASMEDHLQALETHGHLGNRDGVYDDGVKHELLAMSSATIDRYLRSARRRRRDSLLLLDIARQRLGSADHERSAALGCLTVRWIPHHGGHVDDRFLSSLLLTDAQTGWQAAGIFRTGAGDDVSRVLETVRRSLPAHRR